VVRIAILDTGIDLDHPDLDGKIVASVDCVDGTCGPGGDDDNGHGTHVAGIAAAETNNSTGVAGTAPDATLMSVKVLDSGGFGTWSAVAAGIRWAADNSGSVINMSLGGSGYSYIVDDAVEYAWSRNRLLVAAAGNNGSEGELYPARYPEVIGVAAHDRYSNRASWSNYGNDVELTAPGVSINSTYPWGSTACSTQTQYMDGTSMATPFVSGTAALTWARMADTEPCCVTNSDVRSRLLTTADAVSFVKYGQVNACRAVEGSGCE
jgi:thermitase